MSMSSSKEAASWTAGISSVADEAPAPAFLHRAAAADPRARSELGLCLYATEMWTPGRTDLCAQMSLGAARVSAWLSDGPDVAGVFDRRRGRRVARAAQPSRGGTGSSHARSVRMKASLLMLVLLLAGAGILAAQDTTQHPKPAPPPPPPPPPPPRPASRGSSRCRGARRRARRQYHRRRSARAQRRRSRTAGHRDRISRQRGRRRAMDARDGGKRADVTPRLVPRRRSGRRRVAHDRRIAVEIVEQKDDPRRREGGLARRDP